MHDPIDEPDVLAAASSRTETDALGEVEVPAGVLYGAQTQRAIENFPFSDLRLPREMIGAIGLVKSVAAEINGELGVLDAGLARAISQRACDVAEGRYDQQFPVDLFQTGSGTSFNMNANEVIANLVKADGYPEVHPNDHINRGQSSNDVIPTCIHVAASRLLETELLPALDTLAQAIDTRSRELDDVIKTGRTHLMDAMPLSFGQELSGWRSQIQNAARRLRDTAPRVRQLAQGGTAVGTGINTHPRFAERFCAVLSQRTGLAFVPKENFFEALSSADTAVELSGQLRCAAVALAKIANDLRWMNSGPLAGLSEIRLPALQPGSSIMPGKVNPVIPEAIAMVCVHVVGNDASIALAGQNGQFQLNTMLPVIAYHLCQSLKLLTSACHQLGRQCIERFEVNTDHLETVLARNPVLITALTHEIGYERASQIAKQAYREQRPIIDVAEEVLGIDRERLEALLSPRALIGKTTR